jgi:hypothetical protein
MPQIITPLPKPCDGPRGRYAQVFPRRCVTVGA